MFRCITMLLALLSSCPAFAEDQADVFPKMVVEYPLPGATQTHELVSPAGADHMIVISQISDSSVIKVTRDEDGNPSAASRHVIESQGAGLHGLRASEAYPGRVWATLQFNDELLLLDPRSDDVNAAPLIVQRIAVPQPAFGPHVIVEYGDELWVTLKESSYVLRINHRNPTDYTLFPAERKPIFVARSESGMVYASQDQSSMIMRINPKSGEVRQLPIPSEKGSTPVGLITGPDGNVWFVLAGSSAGGTGTFGRIKDDQFQWFHLTTHLGKTAGLLHLAFGEVGNGLPRLHLLSSSIIDPSMINGVFSVSLARNYDKVLQQESIVFPTQYSALHRILVLGQNLFVTELSASALAYVPLPPNRYQQAPEDTDQYSIFGLGIDADRIQYVDP